MSKPKSILIRGKDDGGILIKHNKTHKQICITSWHDCGYPTLFGCVHVYIASRILTVKEFLEELRIKEY